MINYIFALKLFSFASMGATFYTALQILGSLAVFMYGMKLMSEGIQRAAGSSIRQVLRSITRNRFVALLTGFLTTAIVQSSSATTVMTISLVNAGLISLVDSAGVLIGANIGTTTTSWIVTQLGLRFSLHSLSLPLFVIGLPLLLSRRNYLKFWGEFVLGVAILFMGLNYLKISIPDLDANSEMVAWVKTYTGTGFGNRLLYVVIGALFTMIIQSSSAAIVLTITMCVAGWIPFELGVCMVLGQNIGTTVTAEVAALIGNVNARRSARIHTLFNVFGTLLFILILPLMLDLVAWLVDFFFHLEDPRTNPDSSDYGLSFFHTAFNLITALVALPLMGYLVKFATILVPEKNQLDDTRRLKFFNTVYKTPELATIELKKEISRFVRYIRSMHEFTSALSNKYDKREQEELTERIKKYESISNNLHKEVIEYISSLTKEELSTTTSVNLHVMSSISRELEEMGNVYNNICRELNQKQSQKIWLNPTQRRNMNDLLQIMDKAYDNLVENMDSDRYTDAQTWKTKEKIDTARVLATHIRKPVVMEVTDTDEDINYKGSIVYDNLHHQYCLVIDHLENIVKYINERG